MLKSDIATLLKLIVGFVYEGATPETSIIEGTVPNDTEDISSANPD